MVHGDAAGPENLRRNLSDWLHDMGLIQAGPTAAVDIMIGYYQPYATSHDDLDKDEAAFGHAHNAATSLTNLVTQIRSGRYRAPDEGLESPRKK